MARPISVFIYADDFNLQDEQRSFSEGPADTVVCVRELVL